MKAILSRSEFIQLQQRYSRAYFKLYKKYYISKKIIERALAKLDTMFSNGDDEILLDDLLELYSVLCGDQCTDILTKNK